MTPNPNPPNADPAESDDEPGDPLAPIAKRIGARLLDWAFLMTVWMLLGAATSERLADDTLVFQRWAVVAWMALVVVYEVGFVAWRGQTPGKIALKIQLVALKDGLCLVTPRRHHAGASGGLRHRRAGSLLPNRHGFRLLQRSVHEEQPRHPRPHVGLGSDRSPALTVRLRMAWHGRVCRSASGRHARPGAERGLRYLATIV